MAGDITTIARPYAAAVFERAQETGQVAGWSDALGLLATIGADPDMARQIDLSGLMQNMVAGQQVRCTGTQTRLVDCRNGRLGKTRVVRQTKIIIAGKRPIRRAVKIDCDALRRGQ